MSEPRPFDALAGRTIGGRYRLERLLASGGMAQVWEAVDEVLARKVAVKVLHPHLAADEAFVQRFRQEAVAVARLHHPAVVAIYDTCSTDGVEAIVMELVRGRNLRNLLDERGRLEPPVAVGIVAEVAGGLDVAHRAGVVHRDVKPANVLLADDGRVLLADFGVAKAGGDLTVTGATVGTPRYLAPEQVEGGAVDARTDVYALGVVLYEALCGRAPFSGDSDAAVALARLREEPVRPRQVRAGIPRPLEDVILRAMARNPLERYPSAGDLRVALLGVARQEGWGSEVPVPPPATGAPLAADQQSGPGTVVDPGLTQAHLPTMGHTEAPVPSGEGPAARRRRIRTSTVLTLSLILVAGIVAAVLAAGGDDGGGRSSGANPGTPIVITDATAFDPFGDGTENDADAGLVIDGNPATGWRTEGYDDRSFGTKPGVGLVLVLGAGAELSEMVVNSPSNDWAAEIYVASEPEDEFENWGPPVTSGSGLRSGAASFELGGAEGAAVLLWITNLGDEPPRTNFEAREISVTAN